MKPINLGIIGLGYQGKLSLRSSLRLKQARILGVADTSRKALKLAEEMGVRNIYTDYNDLLKNDDIDAVVINLPNFLHLESSIRAAEAGKHILLEKPLATTVEEGEQILSTAKKNSVKLMIGYDLRFSPTLKRIHDEIVDGLFGNVQLADATNVSGGPFSPRSNMKGPVPVPSWWFDKEQAGGGALLDLGSHMIDLLIWYFGNVDNVHCFLGYMFKRDLEDAATCVLNFHSGTIATVHVGWFSKGYLQSVQVCGPARNILIQISPQSTLRTIWNDIRRKVGLNVQDPNYLKLEHFVDCLIRDEQPQPSGEEGLRSLQTISLAYKNAQNNNEYRKPEGN